MLVRPVPGEKETVVKADDNLDRSVEGVRGPRHRVNFHTLITGVLHQSWWSPHPEQ